MKRNDIYITMYHYVRDLEHSRYPNIRGMNINQFREQLEFFDSNFNIICMEELIDSVNGEYDLPEKSLLLTFDDGYIDNYTYVLPLLEEYGMQGSFFIPGKTVKEHKLLDVNKVHYVLASADIKYIVKDLKDSMDYYRGSEYDYPETEALWKDYALKSRFDDRGTVFVKKMLQAVLPEKLRNEISSELFKKYVGISESKIAYELYMSEDQLRTLKRHGMYIGIHGYDHYWLSNLPKKKMQEDIEKALLVMDEYIDRGQWVMNYPYGDYNENVIEFVESKGACLGLTTQVKTYDINIDSRFEIPRFDCNDFPPKSDGYQCLASRI